MINLFIYISDQPQCHSGLPQPFQEVSHGDPYFLPFATSAINVGLYLTSASSTECYVDLIMKHLRKFKSKRNIISHLVPKTEIASKNVIPAYSDFVFLPIKAKKILRIIMRQRYIVHYPCLNECCSTVDNSRYFKGSCPSHKCDTKVG